LADRHFSAEPQAQAIVRLPARWPGAGVARWHRAVQLQRPAQWGSNRIWRVADGIDQYRLAPALCVFAFVPEAPIGQPVGQDRSIAQRTAQMTVMHAFGALVVAACSACAAWIRNREAQARRAARTTSAADRKRARQPPVAIGDGSQMHARRARMPDEA
jgi:hypothetical protein